jgi:hypothetical protein
VGADALVLFLVIVENLQLVHPVNKGDETDDHKNPVDGIGSPPALHEAEKIVRGKKVVYK